MARTRLPSAKVDCPTDIDTVSKVQLARVRVARRVAPVDLFEGAPSGAEWAIAAVLHDLVQATHPGFDAVFRRSGPARLLAIAEATLDRIPGPRTAGDALSRHSWLSRIFELSRTDVEVKWWTGKQVFLGEEPPHRLTAWPELRRVVQTKTPRPLMDLPAWGSAVDPQRFALVVDRLVSKSPLTDLATLDRALPLFVWTHETLNFVSTHAGRTMTMRAFAKLSDRAVDSALGRATRVLFASNALRAASVALDLLRERAVVVAVGRLKADAEAGPIALGGEATDASFALSAGALAATQWIAQTGGGFTETERRSILQVLAPAATSAAAKELRAFLPSG